MTAIDTETVCETWELAITGPDAGCSKIGGCPSPATWRRVQPCGHDRLWCDAHALWDKELIAEWMTGTVAMRCARCGARTELAEITWHRI